MKNWCRHGGVSAEAFSLRITPPTMHKSVCLPPVRCYPTLPYSTLLYSTLSWLPPPPPPPLKGPEYGLRWFTPGGEVDLCGHATLAAAFSLWEEGRADPGLPVRFSTASGVLTCRRDGEGWVTMDFPAEVGTTDLQHNRLTVPY